MLIPQCGKCGIENQTQRNDISIWIDNWENWDVCAGEDAWMPTANYGLSSTDDGDNCSACLFVRVLCATAGCTTTPTIRMWSINGTDSLATQMFIYSFWLNWNQYCTSKSTATIGRYTRRICFGLWRAKNENDIDFVVQSNLRRNHTKKKGNRAIWINRNRRSRTAKVKEISQRICGRRILRVRSFLCCVCDAWWYWTQMKRDFANWQ